MSEPKTKRRAERQRLIDRMNQVKDWAEAAHSNPSLSLGETLLEGVA